MAIRGTVASEGETGTRPLDVIEQVVIANDWSFNRVGEDEISAWIPGRWCDYNLYVTWSEPADVIHLSCALDMRVMPERRRVVNDLLALINEELWLGHFGVWQEVGMPLFRHALPLRGVPSISRGQVEDLVETAVRECERFYPAFQFVLWGGKTPADALACALVETVGEA